jgi:hypothetical protein
MIDAAWLRGLGPERLAAILRHRPDLAGPPVPMTLSELADRLSHRESAFAAMRRLDRPTLQVAEALTALGNEADRATLDRLLLGPDGTDPARAEAVTRALQTLSDHGLLRLEPRPSLVTATRNSWERPLDAGPSAEDAIGGLTADEIRRIARNLGLRPPSRKAEMLAEIMEILADPHRIREIVDGGSAVARSKLHHIATTGEETRKPYSFTLRWADPKAAADPVSWAMGRGLLVQVDPWEDTVVMPAEVALALRGPGYTAPFDPIVPEIQRVEVDEDTVERDVAAVGSATAAMVAAILTEAGRAPLAVLRAGGIGVRELRRIGQELGYPEADVRFALALAHHAGLLAIGRDNAFPTVAFDRWLTFQPSLRLAELLRAWWTLPVAPLAGTGGVCVPDTDEHAGTAELRATMLAEADTASGAAVVDPAALVELAIWRMPYAFGDPDTAAERAMACWQEAAKLGAVGAGAVSAAGRLLRNGSSDLAPALSRIGAAEQSVRLQSDLTAVVSGTPSAELAELLNAAARVESRGTASTWRFSRESVRRALDAGDTAGDLMHRLSEAAVGGVPQPLEHLIGDVARRHGAVRGRAVACCLRSDDSALLDEIAARAGLRRHGLQRLAPTVLASATPLPELLTALRAAGYAPVAETNDGTTIIEQPASSRADPNRPGANAAGAGRRTPVRAPRRAAAPTPTARGAASRRARKPVAPAFDPEALARALLKEPDGRPRTAP